MKLRINVKFTLAKLIQGFIMGCGAILPGVSGSVLSVIFGIYRPLLILFTKPALAFKEHRAILIPACVGWLAGFLWLAKILTIVYRAAPVPTTMAFVGLVLGTVPELMRQADRAGRSRYAYISFALAFIIMFTGLHIPMDNLSAGGTPGFGSFFICGIIWGLSIVIPGFTSSTVLVSIGMFHVVAEGISRLDMSVLSPILLGMIVTAVLLAKIFNSLFEKHHSVLFHAVLGVVFASTLCIIPLKYSGIAEIALSLLGLLLGAVTAWLLGSLGSEENRDTPASSEKD